jgi:hypothetical protein
MNTYLDSQKCFQDALIHGFLSDDKDKENYAGRYMYMGSADDVHYFKTIDTREYMETPRILI